MADRIGFIASLLTVVSFTPQVLKIWRTRDCQAISLRMYLLLVSATGLWAWFGFLIHSTPVILTNSLCFILQLSILLLKVNSLLKQQARVQIKI